MFLHVALIFVTTAVELPFCQIYQLESWFVFETECLSSFSINTTIENDLVLYCQGLVRSDCCLRLNFSSQNSWIEPKKAIVMMLKQVMFILPFSKTNSKMVNLCLENHFKTLPWHRQQHVPLTIKIRRGQDRREIEEVIIQITIFYYARKTFRLGCTNRKSCFQATQPQYVLYTPFSTT